VLLSLACAVTLSARVRAADGSPKRVVFADGRLWILRASGELWSLKPGDQASKKESMPALAFDVCARDGTPLVVTCNGDRCGSFAFWRRDGGTWSIDSKVEIKGDNVVALSCSHEALTVLTHTRVLQVWRGAVRAGGDGWRPRDRAPEPLVTSVHANGDSVFVGLDAGEWGGGLLRIDMKSGKTSVVPGIDPRMDPVNAIETEPWNPACVVAAVGLQHFGPSGQLVEICGEQSRTLYSASAGDSAPGAGDTEAFYGLARSGNVLWAAGRGGVYRVEKDSVKRQPLPNFQVMDGLSVSLGIPGLVVVLRTAHGGMAVGGRGAPTLLSR
jgi:hypothetical protein